METHIGIKTRTDFIGNHNIRMEFLKFIRSSTSHFLKSDEQNPTRKTDL